MRLISLSTFLSLIACVATVENMTSSPVRADTQITDEMIADVLLKTAKDIQKQLPMRIDDATTWTNAIAAGKLVTYVFKLDVKNDSFDAQGFLTRQADYLRSKGPCQVLQMKTSMSYGVKYLYTYKTIEETYVGSIPVDSSFCSAN